MSYNNGNNQGTIRTGGKQLTGNRCQGALFLHRQQGGAGKRFGIDADSEFGLLSNSGAETTTLICIQCRGDKLPQQYSMGNADFELTAGHLKANFLLHELGNKLTRSSLRMPLPVRSP